MSSVIDRPGFAEEASPPFLFSFDQFAKMDEAGVFAGQGRVELIEGRLIEMAPPAADHTQVTSELMGQFYVALRSGAHGGLHALTQGTLKIADHSGPEPDVFVARRRPGQKYYLSEDCVLVIEVAVTTLNTDKTLKRPMYARAAIPEFWLVEPEHRSIRVHRRPGPDGEWGEEVTVTEGAVRPLFAPEIEIVLDQVFAGL